MAMIKCQECGKSISNSAGKCPNCGKPRTNGLRLTVAVIIGVTISWLLFGIKLGKEVDNVNNALVGIGEDGYYTELEAVADVISKYSGLDFLLKCVENHSFDEKVFAEDKIPEVGIVSGDFYDSYLHSLLYPHDELNKKAALDGKEWEEFVQEQDNRHKEEMKTNGLNKKSVSDIEEEWRNFYKQQDKLKKAALDRKEWEKFVQEMQNRYKEEKKINDKKIKEMEDLLDANRDLIDRFGR